MFGWLNFRKKEIRVQLTVMRAEDMVVVHPNTDWSRLCAKCDSPVGIYPSGNAIIDKYGVTNVEIVCNRCVAQDDLRKSQLAPGASQELVQSVRNPRFDKK